MKIKCIDLEAFHRMDYSFSPRLFLLNTSSIKNEFAITTWLFKVREDIVLMC